jgi:hypothetical protein
VFILARGKTNVKTTGQSQEEKKKTKTKKKEKQSKSLSISDVGMINDSVEKRTPILG